jgi:hypothetical protein
MSMAVIDDTPIEETEGTEPATVAEPTFLEIMDRQLRFRGRQLFRAIIIPIRSVFFLEEDSMRDQMIMGNRADIDLLANRLAHAVQGLNLLNERLSAHEDAIPRMRAIKAQLDNTKRIEKELRVREAADAHRSATDEVTEAASERTQRLENGILT